MNLKMVFVGLTWVCSSFGQGYWFSEGPAGDVAVHELRVECGSSRLTRHLCFSSAGDLISTARKLNPQAPRELVRYEWDGKTFSIVSSEVRSYDFFGRFDGESGPVYTCQMASDQPPSRRPNCGCYGSDRGTPACRGRGPLSCK